MNLQYISDSNGKHTGVYIPIEEWKKIKRQLKDIFFEEPEETTKEEILKGIKQAVKEVNQVKKGNLKSRPVEDLLNEL